MVLFQQPISMTIFVEIFTCINNYNKLKPSGCDMSNFRNQLENKSKQLVKRFSTKPVFSMKYSGDYHRNEYTKAEWSRFVEKNANAVTCAGKIHTDLARGFIKAEIVSHEELMTAHNFKDAGAKGLTKLVDADFPIPEKMVLDIRFNV